MFEHPTKVFPCDCGGEGIAVTKYHDEDDISEGEILVSEAEDMRDCEESPFIDFSFWEFGHHKHGRWSWWWRLKIAWYVFRQGSPWPDMVMMKAQHAKNFANHILYLITKGEKEKKLGEPIVKDDIKFTLAEQENLSALLNGKAAMDDTVWDKTSKSKEPLHPYFCVQHGGNDACEKLNKTYGFTCPKCNQDKIVEEIREGKRND